MLLFTVVIRYQLPERRLHVLLQQKRFAQIFTSWSFLAQSTTRRWKNENNQTDCELPQANTYFHYRAVSNFANVDVELGNGLIDELRKSGVPINACGKSAHLYRCLFHRKEINFLSLKKIIKKISLFLYITQIKMEMCLTFVLSICINHLIYKYINKILYNLKKIDLFCVFYSTLFDYWIKFQK